MDFSLWYSDIQRAAGGRGNTLREQQMSRNDIPIIVDSCIAFITQYGEEDEGCGAEEQMFRGGSRTTASVTILLTCSALRGGT